MGDNCIKIKGNVEEKEAISIIEKWIDDAENGKMIHWGDGNTRYILGEKGENPLICIGANPSTAGEIKLTDPTISRIRRIVNEINDTGQVCDGWIMLNLYPQRDKNPDKLHEKYDVEMMKKNHEVIKTVFDKYEKAKTLLAWGNIIDSKKYLKESWQTIASMWETRNWCIRGGFTGRNNPRHQLYVRKNAEIQEVTVDKEGTICL